MHVLMYLMPAGEMLDRFDLIAVPTVYDTLS